MEKDLLLVLSKRTGCMYLSDLKFKNNVAKIKDEIQKLSPLDFPVNQWNDAIAYLTGQSANFSTAIEAKNFLIGAEFVVQRFI